MSGERDAVRRTLLADLVEWANALECRDDIAFSDVMRAMLHVLANPALFGLIDIGKVERTIASHSS